MSTTCFIADKFESSGVASLKALGCDVISEPALADQALADRVVSSGAEVLIVRSTKVTAAMVDTMGGGLKLIIRAGAGVNTIDVKAAAAAGIQVANCPGKNSIAVAELAMGLILAIDRRIPDNVAELRAGRWDKKTFSKARGIFGQTLGVLGAGNIGAEVIKRATAFGMPIVLWDVRVDGKDGSLSSADASRLGLSNTGASISLAPTPADVAARCDVLTIHLAFVPATKGLVNAEVLGRLKPGSTVINTSRAEVVDQTALASVIRERQIRAGLDVYAGEPSAASGPFTDPIAQEAGVYGTHHIGASTDQAQEAIAQETVRIVKEFKATGTAPNRVTA